LWAAAEVETGGRHEGRAPFGIGGIWENWKDLATGEWIRTFAAITTDANALVAEIHDRMPLIIATKDYVRWLGDEPDAHDLAAVSGGRDADVADIDAGKQAGER
jgi:putative SOS response-associated peptidase YedK